MPQIAIDKLTAATATALKNPQATERLRGDTALPVSDSPTQYAAFIAAEQKSRRTKLNSFFFEQKSLQTNEYGCKQLLS